MAFCELATTVYPGCDDMMNRVHQKDNIAAAAVLELREGAFGPAVNNSELAAGQKICVVTAHIHWDPQFCDVKLIQTLMLVDQLVSFHFSILSNFLILLKVLQFLNIFESKKNMNHGHAFKKCQAIDFSQTILSVINYTSITALSQSTTNEFDAFIPFFYYR